ncbi:Ribosomal RNA large subunit methyltransferase N [Mucinivorans hirudinis]|uniref:Probable dual-specificity RNA methyltransferase RlmN n=1 Tax=Mucinivorans hirudinis TaxID=1433126 RepID=A0A060RCV6_9BACT|nr:Ribosomal RNA large subunit methyltransferase N [Mucinivorans hirudinis]
MPQIISISPSIFQMSLPSHHPSPNLLGKSLHELTEIALSFGLKRFAGAQLARWLYPSRAVSFEQMSNISASVRAMLGEKFRVGRQESREVAISRDGTKKYLFETADGNFIESVYIPDNERHTLCISSQAGCRMGCRFCMTARMGFRGQLSAGEIVNQIMSVAEAEQLTNIVYMGMGEPLDNVDNVLRSIEIMTASWGFAWSPTRITLSTIGVLPSLERFLNECKVNLAVSLHSPFDGERTKLMPMQKAYPIGKVLEVLKSYDWRGQRRLTFEYILFEGVNDRREDINELIKLLKGLECRVNLIRFHAIPDSDLRGVSAEKLSWFNGELNSAGIRTTTRSSRGEDILAACGLLATSNHPTL